MKKILFLALGLFLVSVFTPVRTNAQADSSCQIFGSGNSLNVCNGSVKRFYTKFIAGALYGWSVSGNAVIVGPRNLHYVDIQGTALGTARICISYSVNGQDPCCSCVDVNVVACGGGGGGGGCCLQYVNITYDYLAPGGPVLKIKFKDCNPAGSGIVTTKLFISGVLHETQNWISPINPNYTYNHNIRYPGCEQIFCITICGYDANGTLLCCTNVKGVGITCSGTGDPAYGQPIEWPVSYCSGGGGGGGLPIDKVVPKAEPKTDISASSFQLAPNPAGNTIRLSAIPEELQSAFIAITSSEGKVLKSIKVNSVSLEIDIKDLKPGIYRIGGTGKAGKTYFKSFVKQ